jgi:hypothetical protein
VVPKRNMVIPGRIWLEHWDCGDSRGLREGALTVPLARRSA